jgi:O-antigen ligase
MSRRIPVGDAGAPRKGPLIAQLGRTPSPIHQAVTVAPAQGALPGLLLLLLVAIILYLPNEAQMAFDTGIRGLNVINILFLLALAAMLMLGREASQPAPLRLSFVLFFGVLSWALLLALIGDSSAWVEDVTAFKNAIFYMLLYFLFYHAVRDMATVRILVLALLFVVFTSVVLGMRQAFEYGVGNFNESQRVAAPFGWHFHDANRSAVFFCIHLQIVGAAALFVRSRTWLRLACAAVFVGGVFVIFHTYSRQAYAILAALVFLIALRKHLFVALLAVVVLYHYEAWVPEGVIDRIQMTAVDPAELRPRRPPPNFDSPGTGLQPAHRDVLALDGDPFRPVMEPATAEREQQYDESTESRFTLWAGAWELIQRRPMGIGLNRFPREVTPYVPPNLAGKDAHNFYVLITTEAGILAPVILAILLGGLFGLSRRLVRLVHDEEARVLGHGFALAVLAVSLGNVYGSRFLDGDVMGLFWILAALVARTVHLKEQALRPPAMHKAAARAVVNRAMPRGPAAAVRSIHTER